MKRDRKGGSYEWVTLRENNIVYVSGITGMSKADLKDLLRQAKDKGEYEVKLPLGTKVFTREER